MPYSTAQIACVVSATKMVVTLTLIICVPRKSLPDLSGAGLPLTIYIIYLSAVAIMAAHVDWTSLPPEALLQIAASLPSAIRGGVRGVCRLWRQGLEESITRLHIRGSVLPNNLAACFILLEYMDLREAAGVPSDALALLEVRVWYQMLCSLGGEGGMKMDCLIDRRPVLNGHRRFAPFLDPNPFSGVLARIAITSPKLVSR